MSILSQWIEHMPLHRRLAMTFSWSSIILAAGISLPTGKMIVIVSAHGAALIIAIATTWSVLSGAHTGAKRRAAERDVGRRVDSSRSLAADSWSRGHGCEFVVPWVMNAPNSRRSPGT